MLIRKSKDMVLVRGKGLGGMFPLTEAEKDTLHSQLLPENLYIADATLLPKAMGNPPILTIMALTKRISKRIKLLQCAQ